MIFPPSTCVLTFKEPVSIGTYGEVSFAACTATMCSAFVDATSIFWEITSVISVRTVILSTLSTPNLEMLQAPEILFVYLGHVVNAVIGQADLFFGQFRLHDFTLDENGFPAVSGH